MFGRLKKACLSLKKGPGYGVDNFGSNSTGSSTKSSSDEGSPGDSDSSSNGTSGSEDDAYQIGIEVAGTCDSGVNYSIHYGRGRRMTMESRDLSLSSSANSNYDFDMHQWDLRNGNINLFQPCRTSSGYKTSQLSLLSCGIATKFENNDNCTSYASASVFTLFYHTVVLDSTLLSNAGQDGPLTFQIRTLLKDEIVPGLRQTGSIAQDKLKELISAVKLSFLCMNKDPSHFILCLIHHVFRMKPFFSVTRETKDHNGFVHKIICDPCDGAKFTSVQTLLEKSFQQLDNAKFLGLPTPTLFLQLPRTNGSLTHYQGVFCNLTLDITDIMDKSVRACVICGKPAERECMACFNSKLGGKYGMQATSYCRSCLHTAHREPSRRSHITQKKVNKLALPLMYNFKSNDSPIDRVMLELMAIICVSPSGQYSTFMKYPGKCAKWVVASKDGPEDQAAWKVKPMPRTFSKILSRLDQEQPSMDYVRENWHELPDGIKDLMRDGFLCVYTIPNGTLGKTRPDSKPLF